MWQEKNNFALPAKLPRTKCPIVGTCFRTIEHNVTQIVCENKTIEWHRWQAQAQVLANGQPLEWAQWKNRTRCYYSNYIENCQAKHKLIVGNTIAILHFMPGGISGAWETQVECGNVADRWERQTERDCVPYHYSLENSTRPNTLSYHIWIESRAKCSVETHKKYLSMSRTLFAN